MMSKLEPDQILYPEPPAQAGSLQRVEADSLIAANVGILWRGKDCRFSDWRYLPRIDLLRDYLPTEIKRQLIGGKQGSRIQHSYGPGTLVSGWSWSRLKTIDSRHFQPPSPALQNTKPALGRFYAPGFFRYMERINPADLRAGRITGMEESRLKVDFNHPLAKQPITLMLDIHRICQPGGGRIEQPANIPSAVCDHGPGMQDELAQGDTDFLSGRPFSRLDEGKDEAVFQPSFNPYWDRSALSEVSRLYKALIPEHSRVLDLMAGVHSPLQESAIRPAHLVAAGLNSQELEHNPLCDERHVLNVNEMTSLPFADAQFDVVLIHAAIEYAIRPALLFAEISRVLARNGKLIISFSNRSVDEKAIQLWTHAYEFERPAIILSFLRRSGCFEQFTSFSQRDHIRPQDDKLSGKLQYSDPVYLICALRA